MLLFSVLGTFTRPATVHHAANAGMVAHPEFRHVLSDRRDNSRNFMPGHLRIFLRTPIAAKLMMSEWQMPQNLISISTSSSPSGRRSNDHGPSFPEASQAA